MTFYIHKYMAQLREIMYKDVGKLWNSSKIECSQFFKFLKMMLLIFVKSFYV